jgi:hypothetical protein
MKGYREKRVRQPLENEAMPIASPALLRLACPKNNPLRRERVEEPALS